MLFQTQKKKYYFLQKRSSFFHNNEIVTWSLSLSQLGSLLFLFELQVIEGSRHKAKKVLNDNYISTVFSLLNRSIQYCIVLLHHFVTSVTLR